jgi:hypothetical protein
MNDLLSQLVDKDDIRSVLATYCMRLDECDIDSVVQLFTHECTTDYGKAKGGKIVGRAKLRERLLGSQKEYRRTQHILGQSLIEIDRDRRAAHAVTYFIAWHETWAQKCSTIRARYVDRLVRTAAGWQIDGREVIVLAADGPMAAEPWAWLDRARPDAG